MAERAKQRGDSPDGWEEGAAVVPLTVAGVDELRISWWSPLGRPEIARYARRFPDLVWRVRGERDFVIGGLWRGRPEIGLLVYLSANRHRAPLLARLLESFRQRGVRAVILSDSEVGERLKWYLENGWRLFEEIVVYERPHCRPIGVKTGELEITPFRMEELDKLMAVDRAAFPWLWWNDREDFQTYVSAGDVSCYVAKLGQEMVGYVSFTVHDRQGHLDRIAVLPGFQGHGYGTELLSVAIDSMASAGARKVSLTTQINNRRSQALYEKYGFRRARGSQRLYGVWLNSRRTGT